MGDISVHLKNLHARYAISADWILRNITLGVRKGEMLVLMGPSGCGKSTLLYVVAGLLPWVIPGVVKGEILVEGINVVEDGYKGLIGQVGIVFQNPEMQVIAQSVYEELSMIPENIGLPKDEVIERVEWVVNALDLSRYLTKNPQSLSGGEKQLLAIASVLTMRPKVLLLDEPTSMLDHRGTQLVLDTVSLLKREHGLTIVAAEHKVEWAVEVADRISVMHEGSIVLEGEPEELFSRVEEIEKYGVRPPGASEVAYELRRAGIKTPIPVRLNDALRVYGL
ncbi:MAG: ATP-binding cassette domain-containing protein [Thermofilaceae archaeon]